MRRSSLQRLATSMLDCTLISHGNGHWSSALHDAAVQDAHLPPLTLFSSSVMTDRWASRAPVVYVSLRGPARPSAMARPYLANQGAFCWPTALPEPAAPWAAMLPPLHD